jgi:hypothetical protein
MGDDSKARYHLNREHRSVDGKHRPQDAPVTFIPAMRVDCLVAAKMHS